MSMHGIASWYLALILLMPGVSDIGSELEIQAQGLNPAPERMLELLRRRTEPTPPVEQMQKWVQQLADPSQRADGLAGLIGTGSRAIPVLRQFINNASNLAVADLARQCLANLEGNTGLALTQAVIQILADKNPAGSTEVLLRYLPQAEDDELVGRIQNALITIRRSQKTADKALLASLRDEVPLRRAVAASVLAATEGSATLDLVRPLLNDPRSIVRFRVAMALVENLDGTTVPLLIDLLPSLPARARQEVEEFLTQLAGDWGFATPKGADSLSLALKMDLWQVWWKRLDGPTLLEEFRKRQPSDSELVATIDSIEKLDDPNAMVRQQSLANLLRQNPRILPLLRQAIVRGGSQQVVNALNMIVQRLAPEEVPPLPTSALQLLALRNPEGTLATLLAWLPLVEDHEQAEKLIDLIIRMELRSEQADPLLIKALDDPILIRRVVASRALLRRSDPALVARIQKLLDQSSLKQRWLISRELAEQGDRTVIPRIISLLTDLPMEEAGEVEDFLGFLALDHAPNIRLEADPKLRLQCRDAWLKWWNEKGAQVDLGRIKQLQTYARNLVLVESYNPTGRTGSTAEITRSGREIWKIQELMFPTDAQVLPGGRVLVAEQNVNRVSERDLKGKILWEKQFVQPIGVRRLRNRHTLIGGRNQIVVVDPAGKEIFTHPVNGETVLAIAALTGGLTAYVTYQGNYVVLDSTGKEVKKMSLFPNNLGASCAQILPGDRVLVGINGQGRVVEYDSRGKVTWETATMNPIGVTRLPGGRTLIATASNSLVEIDRGGKIVHEWKNLPIRVFQASPR